jgi:hypothetical protein
MDVAHYHYLRECELDAALAQSQAGVAAGRYVVESARAHVARLDGQLVAREAAPRKSKPARKTTLPSAKKVAGACKG